MMTLLVVGIVTIVSAQGGTEPPPAIPQSWWQNGTTFGQIVILISTIIGTIATLWTQHRNRKWDLEDRRQAREDLKARLDAEAHGREEIAKDLRVNTDISKRAFKEANSVSEKIAQMGMMFDSVRREAAADAARQIAQVQAVAKDTNQMVRELGKASNGAATETLSKQLDDVDQTTVETLGIVRAIKKKSTDDDA
jgi:hypothetical protein